jgi:hypothetical protein
MCFRGIADNRYYLNGVYLETGSEGARLVATNGTILGIANLHKDTHSGTESSIIIPEKLCMVVQKLSPRTEYVTFEFNEGSFCGAHNTSGHRTIDLVHGDDVCSGTEVLGFFPDFRAVVPESFSGESAKFEPGLLLRIEKAAKLINGKNALYPQVTYNGKGIAIAMVRDDFMVLVMPITGYEDQLRTPPVWAKSAVHKPPLPIQESMVTSTTVLPPSQTSQFALEI